VAAEEDSTEDETETPGTLQMAIDLEDSPAPGSPPAPAERAEPG
jgi:hypothetical protein